MSRLRSLCKFLGSFAFTTALSLLITTASLAEITSYESMKPLLVSLFVEKIAGDSAKAAETYAQLLAYCQSRDSVEMPMDSEKIEVKCSDIKSSRPEDINNVIASAMFDKVYYKKYSCSFVDCIKSGGDNLLIVASSTGNKFFQDSIVYTAAATAIGAVIILVLAETFAGRLKTLGADCMSVGALAFLILLSVIILPKFIPAESLGNIGEFLGAITNTMTVRFLFVFAAGAVLFATGFFTGRKKR